MSYINLSNAKPCFQEITRTAKVLPLLFVLGFCLFMSFLFIHTVVHQTILCNSIQQFLVGQPETQRLANLSQAKLKAKVCCWSDNWTLWIGVPDQKVTNSLYWNISGSSILCLLTGEAYVTTFHVAYSQISCASVTELLIYNLFLCNTKQAQKFTACFLLSFLRHKHLPLCCLVTLCLLIQGLQNIERHFIDLMCSPLVKFYTRFKEPYLSPMPWQTKWERISESARGRKGRSCTKRQQTSLCWTE